MTTFFLLNGFMLTALAVQTIPIKGNRKKNLTFYCFAQGINSTFFSFGFVFSM